MVREQRRLHGLAELCGRIRIGAHAALLENDVAFGRDDLVAQHEARHAIGLEPHQGGEMFLRGALEVGGIVVGGESVFLPAEFGHHLGELALRMGLGSLEHEMFQEMRDPRLPDRVIGRSVAVPDHVGDHGRPMIRDNHEGETVVEQAMGD